MKKETKTGLTIAGIIGLIYLFRKPITYVILGTILIITLPIFTFILLNSYGG